MSQKRRRIYGVEVEFGGMPGSIFERQNPTGGGFLWPFILKYLPAIGAMRRYAQRRGSNLGLFLSNEARVYQDNGFHIEYCTPETASPRDAVIWEKAGERILEDLLGRLNGKKEVADCCPASGVTFIKNNVCDYPGENYRDESWGCHLNFSTSRKIELIAIAAVLAPFLASSHIWSGAGRLRYQKDTERFAFEFSQRAGFIGSNFGNDTTSSRTLVNGRDESLADAQVWRRVHLIASDSHMSELISYLNLSLIGLLLRMIEDSYFQGSRLGRLLSWDEGLVGLIKKSNSDLTLLKTFLVGGKNYSPLDIQRIYLEMFLNFEREAEFSEEESDALGRYQKLLEKLELARAKEEPEIYLYRECDWAAKLMLLKRDAAAWGYDLYGPVSSMVEHRAKNGNMIVTTAGARMSLLDLEFHDIRRDRGWHYKLEAAGLRERIASDVEITEAKSNPPQNTRARLRRLDQDEVEKKDYEISSWSWTHTQAIKSPDFSDRYATKNYPDPFQFKPQS